MGQKIQVKCLAIILVLALSAATEAEPPVVEWIQQLGSAGVDGGFGVSVDGNGNAYVAGYTQGSLDGNTSAGYDDAFLTKYATDGTKLWTEQIGSTENDYGRDVSVDSNGNAYVTGITYGNLDGNTNVGAGDMFLTKYDTNGTKLWTELLGSASLDRGYGVSIDASGNAYVAGETAGSLDGNTNAGGYDSFLTKYDTDGTKLWTKLLGSARDDGSFGVSVDGSGNAYVTGYTYGNLDGNLDMFLTKYDTDGTKLWTEQLGSSSSDTGYDVSVDANGNIYVTGETTGNLDGNINAGYADMFLTKYNSDGTKLWTELLGSASGDGGLAVSVDSCGNAYVTGYTIGNLDGNTNAGSSDIFLTKYDTDGTKLWTELLGSANGDYGSDIWVDDCGNAYIAGDTSGSLDGNPNAGEYDMFLVKISNVPEPGSIVMLAGIAFMALLLHRKRKRD